MWRFKAVCLVRLSANLVSFLLRLWGADRWLSKVFSKAHRKVGLLVENKVPKVPFMTLGLPNSAAGLSIPSRCVSESFAEMLLEKEDSGNFWLNL